MPEPNMLVLSRLMSDLVNTPVTFKPARPTELPKASQVFGTYTILPDGVPLVVQADLALLGSLAGAFTAMPNTAVGEHLEPMSEVFRDAIHEILNISSTAVVTAGRAVFQTMAMDVGAIEGAAGGVLRAPHHSSYFDVSVDRYRGGKFTIFSGPLG